MPILDLLLEGKKPTVVEPHCTYEKEEKEIPENVPHEKDKIKIKSKDPILPKLFADLNNFSRLQGHTASIS